MATTFTVIEHDMLDADPTNYRPLAPSQNDGEVLTAHDDNAGNITLAWEEPVEYPMVSTSLQVNSQVAADNQALIVALNDHAGGVFATPDVCYRISELAKAEKNHI